MTPRAKGFKLRFPLNGGALSLGEPRAIWKHADIEIADTFLGHADA